MTFGVWARLDHFSGKEPGLGFCWAVHTNEKLRAGGVRPSLNEKRTSFKVSLIWRTNPLSRAPISLAVCYLQMIQVCPNQQPFGLLGAGRKLNMTPIINRFGPLVTNTTRVPATKSTCLRYIRSSLPLRGLEFIHFPKAARKGQERLPRAVKRSLSTDKFMWVRGIVAPTKVKEV